MLFMIYLFQEYFKKPSACYLVEKHEIDYWSGHGGHSLSLCCGITCLWGSCLDQMCGVRSLLGGLPWVIFRAWLLRVSNSLSESWQVEWDWIIHSLQTESFWSLAIQTEHLVVKRTKVQHLNSSVKVHHIYLQTISLKRNQMYRYIK